jgi:AraC-like DNA-binding protein
MSTTPKVVSSAAATVRELIDRCSGSVGFRVKVVCADLHISQSTITQEFKNRYQMTILEYWSQIRLNRACAILAENSPKTIGLIASELGYQHPSNFANWFTRRMGMSPQQYKANCLQKNTAGVFHSADPPVPVGHF